MRPWDDTRSRRLVNSSMESVAASYEPPFDAVKFHRFDSDLHQAFRSKDTDRVEVLCDEFASGSAMRRAVSSVMKQLG